MMNKSFTRYLRKGTSVLLLGSMLCSQGVLSASAAENKNAVAGYAMLQSTVSEQVNLNDQAHSIAGMGLNLDDYFGAVSNARISKKVSKKVEKDLMMLTDKKASVLEDYNKLGIADVNGSNYLNVRKKPASDGEICGKMTKYTACDILKKSGDWYKVKSGSVTGYVFAEYIITGSEAEKIAVEEAEKMAVVTTDSNLNVRKKPSTDSKIITKISENERYSVLSQKNGWVKISLEGLLSEDGDGKDEESVGYISADYCDVKYALKAAMPYTPLEEKGTSTYTSTRAAICNYGSQFVGNPYVWGGTSLTHGADCSGFVMSVFAKYGIYLPRTSREQAYAGRRITSSEMRPGDLVFYGSGYINHVAIYIGNGMIVHAANTRRGIVFNSWNYMTPVRIVNVLGN